MERLSGDTFKPRTLFDFTMEFGAQTEYGRLRKVLMHRPDEGMKVVTAGNKEDYLFRDPVYWREFQAEHDAFTQALRDEGVEVVLLGEVLDRELRGIASKLPNLVYTRDTAMITKIGACIMRMRYAARFVEPTLVEKAIQRLGIPVALRVEPPATVEGGDFVWLDEETLLMGYGTRTNEAGVNQLRDALLGRCIKTLVAQPLPSWRVHLDGALMVLAPHLALYNPTALERYPSYVYSEDGVELRWLGDFLKERGVELLRCTDTEVRMFGTNIVGLGDGKCVSYEWNERIIPLLEERGFEVIPIPGSQLAVGGGGPHCLTCPILRD